MSILSLSKQQGMKQRARTSSACAQEKPGLVQRPDHTLWSILRSGYSELGIDSTQWVCLCSDLEGCPSCMDTASILGYLFTMLLGIPLTPSSLGSAMCYFHVSLILDLFFHFVEVRPPVDFLRAF